ncbi:hypothetical protein PHMEG_0006454 [Phytophthora megakarya]|uniref:Multicopper oxidase n=1 Tax=Phytophthora megakarya TaxID=4795 RepID=A0A225WQW8_9STRA|nr:hypothetical protein PHMEG_0006454 [Phytophthora megakarya]
MTHSHLATILVSFLVAQFSIGLASSDVVTYDWRLTPIWTAFDGVLLQTLGVNNKPCDETVIEVELGQEVEVRVTNELYDPTCLHWHGMKQLGTQEMDGVSGFTQCFIQPNTTAVYRFKPDKAGTFWWHSHHKTQYAFGLRGPLIVHAPENERRTCEKDIDQEYTVQLGDIYHTAPTLGPALWDTIVINNRGRFDCAAAALNNLTQCSSDQPLSNFQFQGGKKYLLRLINMAAMAPIDFSIDDHEFQVIAADGEPVMPTQLINSIFINAGQRYDIIVKGKTDTQGVDSFWMRAKGLSGLPWMVRTADSGLPGFNDEGLAIVRYNTANSEPTTTQCEGTVTVNEYDFTPDTISALPTTPSDRSIVQFNISQVGGVISLDGGEYHSHVIPDQPPLLTISNGSTTADLPATANARQLEYGNHVEVVVVNSMNEQHPFHLHSHAPWVVGSGQASAEDVYDNNLPPSKLQGAMLRDVYTVPPCTTDENDQCINVGYVILRFTADNPGVWMMHCHIDWHMDIGLSMIYVEGEKELQEKGPDSFSSSLLSVSKKYVLRLINMAAMATFAFSIDGHEFQMIATDAEPAVPTDKINSITINVADETVTIGEFDFTPAALDEFPAAPDDRSTMRSTINTTIGTGIVSLDGGAFQTLVVPDEPPLLTIASGLTTAELTTSANARAIRYGNHIQVVLMTDVIEEHPFHLHSRVGRWQRSCLS